MNTFIPPKGFLVSLYNPPFLAPPFLSQCFYSLRISVNFQEFIQKMRSNSIRSFFNLAFVTQHNYVEIHLHYWVYRQFIPFCCRVVFHGIITTQCVYPFTYDGHLSVSNLGLLQIELYEYSCNRSLGGHVILFLLDRYLEMEWPSPMVNVCLTF